MLRSKNYPSLVVLVSLAFFASFLRADTSAVPSTEKPAIPVIEVHGTSVEMGAQHGKQLAKSIDFLHEHYLKVFLGTTSKRLMAIGAAHAFEKNISPEHLAEINGMAEQCGMDPDEAVLAQCFLDLTAMSACSTITLPADAAPDHVARFGRNLDFPSLNIADKYTTVFIYKPGDGRYKFVSVGWPGMIGVLSGMNEHGLALANMEVKRPARLPTAMPYTLLYRTVLEKCKTVDEAIDLLEKTPKQTANNLMLMDAGGHRAVVEITPAGITVRRGVEGTSLLSTNHQRGEDTDTAGRCNRYDFLHDTSKEKFGHIDEAELQKMLAGASQDNFTLQTMVFEPSNRVMYLSAGKNSARGTFTKIDLREYFK